VRHPRTLLIGATATLLAACGPRGPRPITLGTESCGHCHMTIADPRFTAEAISNTGKTFVFDDVDCLAAWLGEHSTPIASAWVTSFVDREHWLPADSAVYLRTDSLHTPMGSGLIALRAGGEADSVQRALGGSILTWREVLLGPHSHRPPSPT
jgi:copper chaperone NosL